MNQNGTKRAQGFLGNTLAVVGVAAIVVAGASLIHSQINSKPINGLLIAAMFCCAISSFGMAFLSRRSH
jgi:hypothetical protein